MQKELRYLVQVYYESFKGSHTVIFFWTDRQRLTACMDSATTCY